MLDRRWPTVALHDSLGVLARLRDSAAACREAADEASRGLAAFDAAACDQLTRFLENSQRAADEAAARAEAAERARSATQAKHMVERQTCEKERRCHACFGLAFS